jgi:diguanylate cyclase (GGDEF)-like protein
MVRVRGVVTYYQSDRGLYVQNGQRGVFVTTDQASYIPLGSEVEVLGYPAVGRYSPAMSNAVVRIIGPESPIMPKAGSASDMIVVLEDGNSIAPFDAVLVNLQGHLLQDIQGANEEQLLLQDGNLFFTAVLPRSGQKHADLNPGSLLRVTGICVAKVDEAHEARSFEILLRSLADISVVQRASWWTLAHAQWSVAFLLLVIFIILAWMAVNRRQANLRTLTITDELTGLYNRRGFFLLTEHQWRVALRHGTSTLLFFMDVDDFKSINDHFGHDEGDRGLQELANLLRECFRRADIVARIGGDEFAVFTDFASPESSNVMEHRLAAMLEKRNHETGRGYELSLSVGVLICNSSLREMSVADLLAEADKLMYERKRAKKNHGLNDENVILLLPPR